MSAEDSVNDPASDWSSSDESERQVRNGSNIEAQPSGVRPPLQSQRRPARPTLPFVPYADWVPGQSYDDLPPSFIHYIMEWKLTVNKRVAAKQTEDNLVVAPSEFWDEELLAKLADIIQSRNNPCEADATTIVVSVNDRSEHDITKRFKKLEIDWPVIERQLQTWSHLLRIGKRLRINVSFNYVESKVARTAGRGATATQLAERGDRLDAEQAVLDRPAAWRYVYDLLRCDGPPCDRGPHCWQDSTDGNKHYRLLTHHLREIVKFVQGGGELRTHDDVPPHIRTQLQKYDEPPQGKRKRGDSSAGPVIINNYIPAYPSPSTADSDTSALHSVSSRPSRASSLTIPGLRDDAVKACRRWHCSKVGDPLQKQHYELVCTLTLERGFDLELVYEDGDAGFYIERGVMEGVARRWIRDVPDFLEQYNP